MGNNIYIYTDDHVPRQRYTRILNDFFFLKKVVVGFLLYNFSGPRRTKIINIPAVSFVHYSIYVPLWRPCFGKQQWEKRNVMREIIRNFSHSGHGWKIWFLRIKNLNARPRVHLRGSYTDILPRDVSATNDCCVWRHFTSYYYYYYYCNTNARRVIVIFSNRWKRADFARTVNTAH